jgi:hypothetical protein
MKPTIISYLQKSQQHLVLGNKSNDKEERRKSMAKQQLAQVALVSQVRTLFS